MGGNPNYETPYFVKPFYKGISTINTTAYVAANRSQVWPVVRAQDRWSTFQEIFDVQFTNEGNGIVELGQNIRITSNFPLLGPQVTLEQYDEIVEENRLCYNLKSIVLGGFLEIPCSYYFLRTARCVELFDDPIGFGTIVHNWISYAGIGWPFVYLFTGASTKDLFDAFNAELAVEFV